MITIDCGFNNELRVIPLTFYSTVTGQPFDHPRGRWRVGGGINVPLNVTFETNKTQATEIKRILTKKGIQAILQNADGNMKK